jgi:hypothetical protein
MESLRASKPEVFKRWYPLTADDRAAGAERCSDRGKRCRSNGWTICLQRRRIHPQVTTLPRRRTSAQLPAASIRGHHAFAYQPGASACPALCSIRPPVSGLMLSPHPTGSSHLAPALSRCSVRRRPALRRRSMCRLSTEPERQRQQNVSCFVGGYYGRTRAASNSARFPCPAESSSRPR